MAGAIYTCPYVILSSRKNFTCRNFSLGLKEFEAVCKRHVSSIRSSSVNFVLKNRLPAFECDPCKRRFSCAFAGRVRHSLGGWNWSLSRQCSRWVFFFHWKFDSLTVYSSWIVVKDDVLKRWPYWPLFLAISERVLHHTPLTKCKLINCRRPKFVPFWRKPTVELDELVIFYATCCNILKLNARYTPYNEVLGYKRALELVGFIPETLLMLRLMYPVLYWIYV